MPKGVETFVADGFATVDFVDPSLRGQALAKLVAIGGPESVETITRDGPRRKYRVPEGNASEAGLIDSVVDQTARGDLKFAQALADADPIADGGEFRPDVHTVKGANAAGPVEQAAVAGNQSVTTTESDNPAPVTALAPPHAEVIKVIQDARAQMHNDIEARAEERGPAPTYVSGTPTIAAQMGALGSDPQSRPSLSADRDVFKAGAPGDRFGGAPSMQWTRQQIDAHAKQVHGIDTTEAATKREALEQIEGTKS